MIGEREIIEKIQGYANSGVDINEATPEIVQWAKGEYGSDPIKILHLIRENYNGVHEQEEEEDILWLPYKEKEDETDGWSLVPVEEIENYSIDKISSLYKEIQEKYGIAVPEPICTGFCTQEDVVDFLKDAVQREEVKEQYFRDIEERTLNSLFYESDRGKIKCYESKIAEYLIKEMNIISFNSVNNKIGQLFVYKNGYYQENTGEIQRAIIEILDEFGYTDSVTESTRNILHFIAFKNPNKEYPFNIYPNLIPVKNCVLEIDYENRAVRPQHHDPKYMFSYCLPVFYDPGAPTSPIEDVISEWVDQKDVVVKYQIPAQALLQAQRRCYKKAYINDGGRDAGKSSYLVLLERFFGSENLGDVSLQEICDDPFGIADLENKLINFHDDLASVPLKYLGKFKKVTGSIEHRINRKHQQPYKAVITAVNVFSCNGPPKLKDVDDEAFFRRWEYTVYPNQFEIDPSFYDRAFTDENLSGFLKLVIETMIAIERNGRLIKDTDPEYIKEKWVNATEPILEFFTMNFNTSQSDYVVTDEAYEGYKMFCKDQKITAESKTRFSILFNQMNGVSISQARVGKRRPKVYKGIVWSDMSPYKPNQTEDSQSEL